MVQTGNKMVKNAKTRITQEQNITFLFNKKNLLCVRWHILRSYRFVAEVTFNNLAPSDKFSVVSWFMKMSPTCIIKTLSLKYNYWVPKSILVPCNLKITISETYSTHFETEFKVHHKTWTNFLNVIHFLL